MATTDYTSVLFLVCLSFLLASSAMASALHPDMPALLAIASSFAPTLASWEPSRACTPCSWPGIECSRTSNEAPARVTALRLANLSLRGRIPAAIANLTELQTLDLHGNRIFGGVPTAMAGLRRLEELDLRDNVLSGAVPAELAAMERLQVLRLGGNRLSGASVEAMASLGFCRRPGLHVDLCGNLARGRKPASSLAVPSSIAEPPSSPAAASGARLSQKAPVVRRRSLAAPRNSSAAHNSSHTPAHGPAQAPAALSPAPLPKAKTHHRKKQPLVIRWLAGLAAGMATGALSAAVGLLAYRRLSPYLRYLRRERVPKPAIFNRRVLSPKDLEFLKKDDALEGMQLLGTGGSGCVYRASLENDKIVAIKTVMVATTSNIANKDEVEIENLTRHSKQIKAEVKTLGHIRHRNLVALLAHVPKPRMHIIVYEFMENGSLRDVMQRAKRGEIELTWPMRLDIALGIAAALKYLHEDCKPPIVHRDLKPANILLDGDFEAHIGDFGLAEFLASPETHYTSEAVAGTVGYIAPEYHQIHKWSPKTDIYSFGVVLVVLLTGKEPTHHFFSDVHTHMGAWVQAQLEAGDEVAMASFDSALCGKGFERQMLSVLKIAYRCVKASPKDRPTSFQVLDILSQVKLRLNVA